MQRADTLTVATDPESGDVMVSAELWRTDSGSAFRLRRMAIRLYDLVFEG